MAGQRGYTRRLPGKLYRSSKTRLPASLRPSRAPGKARSSGGGAAVSRTHGGTDEAYFVADDDRTTRLLISELLERGKFTVVTAADGADALKKLK